MSNFVHRSMRCSLDDPIFQQKKKKKKIKLRMISFKKDTYCISWDRPPSRTWGLRLRRPRRIRSRTRPTRDCRSPVTEKKKPRDNHRRCQLCVSINANLMVPYRPVMFEMASCCHRRTESRARRLISSLICNCTVQMADKRFPQRENAGTGARKKLAGNTDLTFLAVLLPGYKLCRFKYIRVALHIYWRFVAAWIFIGGDTERFEIFTS